MTELLLRPRGPARGAAPSVVRQAPRGRLRSLLRNRLHLLGAAALAVCFAGPATPRCAGAHALDPVLFELRERDDGFVDVTWKAPNAKVPGVDLRPILPASCRRTSEPTVEDEAETVVSTWTMDCGGGLAGLELGVEGLESTDALLRIALRSGAVDRHVLSAERPTAVVEGDPSRWQVLVDYGRLGAEHIAGGVDHLLFVFGLLLLTGGTRLLLATVTAFTVGHSVTLALAALELLRVPQAPVEVIIAVTIWILAAELSRPADAPPTMLRRRPWGMAFAFGLLHGLGFAGALREAGLPAGDVPLALLSFNLGIEAGQLVFVGAVLVLARAASTLVASAPAWLRLAPVYGMGTAATYWILVRAAAL